MTNPLSEFRIGNLIKYGKSNETYRITSLITDAINEELRIVASNGHNKTLDIKIPIEGDQSIKIQLTAYWLNKSGLKNKDFWPNSWELGEFALEFQDGEFVNYTVSDGVVIGNPIKHVHQLQNRFYSLYGTELEISK